MVYPMAFGNGGTSIPMGIITYPFCTNQQEQMLVYTTQTYTKVIDDNPT